MRQNYTLQKDTRTGIYQAKFSNGLDVYMLEKSQLPIVTVMISYRLGGAHSSSGATGVAHLLEHLMFKGTKRFGKGEIDSLTQRLGGSNNAFTGVDYTSYFFNFTKEHWEKALEIESDRMENCVWDKKEFEAEKKVVLEELASSQDSSYEFLSQEAELAFYKFHPYRYPILGWKEDLENLTVDVIDQYYKTYYAPNNAILVIVGDIKKEEAIKKIDQYFGKIPSQKIPKFICPKELPFKSKKRLDLYANNTEASKFIWLFPTCPCGNKDEFALDLIDIMLSVGKTSRLYQRMVLDGHLLQRVGSNSSVHKEAGLFGISGELIPRVHPLQIEKIVQDELEDFKKHKISKYELIKAKNICLSSMIYHQETVYDIAERISQDALEESSFSLEESMENIQKITPENIQEIAQKYFCMDRSLIAWSLPKKEKILPFKSVKEKKKEKTEAIPSLYKDRKISFQHGTGAKKNNGIFDVKTYCMENGMQLMILENHTIPCASMKLFFLDSMGIDPEGKEGMNYLLSSLLTEGTKKFTGQEISHTLEFIGANLSGSCNGITGKCISQDIDIVLGLMAEISQRATFPEASLQKEKKKLLARLISLKDDPYTKGMIALRRHIYGKHPYGKFNLGNKQSISRINVEDIQKYYETYFVPERSVLSIVGDVDANYVYKQVKKHFGSWKKVASQPPIFPEVFLPKKAYTQYIPMEKEQLIVYLGHIGIRRSNPDFYKLILLEQILGQGQGFTDRLSKKIRDEFGLCYSVECSLTTYTEREPGIVVAFLATTPKHYALAMQTLKEEISLIQEKGVTEDELESAKSYLKGKTIFALEESDALTQYLLHSHLFHLGFNHINKIPEIFEKITTQDIQKAAKKYLHFELATTVVVGPVDQILPSK